MLQVSLEVLKLLHHQHELPVFALGGRLVSFIVLHIILTGIVGLLGVVPVKQLELVLEFHLDFEGVLRALLLLFFVDL